MADRTNESSNHPANGGNPPPAAVLLEQAMMACAQKDTPETRTHFFQELLLSDLILALADPNAEKPEEQPAEGEIRVAILTNSDNMQFAAVFTSVEAARQWRTDGGSYAPINGQDVFKLLHPSPAQTIVINPGSTLYALIGKEECKILAGAMVPSPARPSPVRAEPRFAFPNDAFSADQISLIHKIAEANPVIEAVGAGAILPPGGNPTNGWVRALFLRIHGMEDKAEAVQVMCNKLREDIVTKSSLFKESPFEVGVMPDPGFWTMLHKDAQNAVLFDRNPPTPNPA